MADSCIYVQRNGRIDRINISAIIYLERDKRKITIVTDYDKFIVYGRLESIEPLLDKSFYLCLKRLYVNFDKIVTLYHGGILFSNGELKHVGMNNYQRMLRDFRKYIKITADVDDAYRNFDEKIAK